MKPIWRMPRWKIESREWDPPYCLRLFSGNGKRKFVKDTGRTNRRKLLIGAFQSNPKNAVLVFFLRLLPQIWDTLAGCNVIEMCCRSFRHISHPHTAPEIIIICDTLSHAFTSVANIEVTN